MWDKSYDIKIGIRAAVIAVVEQFATRNCPLNSLATVLGGTPSNLTALEKSPPRSEETLAMVAFPL